MKYWFKPARFWKWFAAYYPVSWEGWFASIVIVTIGIVIFRKIDLQSSSVSDTLLMFAPWAIALFLIFDMLCFRRGEYPSWWKGDTC